MSSRVRGYLPEIAIATAAILYGSTFTILQDALHDLIPAAIVVAESGTHRRASAGSERPIAESA